MKCIYLIALLHFLTPFVVNKVLSFKNIFFRIYFDCKLVHIHTQKPKRQCYIKQEFISKEHCESKANF